VTGTELESGPGVRDSDLPDSESARLGVSDKLNSQFRVDPPARASLSLAANFVMVILKTSSCRTMP
jgi:hypothetical protein